MVHIWDVYPPMDKKKGKINHDISFVDKIHMEYGDYELALLVAFVFMRETTAKLLVATTNPTSKYCCRDVHITSFLQSRMD